MQSQTLNLKEAADLLKINYHTAQALAASGELPGDKIGRSWVFIEEDLIAWLRERIKQRQAERLGRKAPVAMKRGPSNMPAPLPKPPGQVGAS